MDIGTSEQFNCCTVVVLRCGIRIDEKNLVASSTRRVYDCHHCTIWLTFIDPFLSIKVLQSIGYYSKRTIGSCFLAILKEEKFEKTDTVYHHAPHSNEDRCSPLSSSFTLPQIVNVTSLV